MHTLNTAGVFGIADIVGNITVGKHADMILLEPSKNLLAINPISMLLSIEIKNVKDVFVGLFPIWNLLIYLIKFIVNVMVALDLDDKVSFSIKRGISYMYKDNYDQDDKSLFQDSLFQVPEVKPSEFLDTMHATCGEWIQELHIQYWVSLLSCLHRHCWFGSTNNLLLSRNNESQSRGY